VENGFGNECRRVASSEETCRIAGRNWGSLHKQESASFTTRATPPASLSSGGGRRWSKTSFKSVLPPTDGDGDGDEEEEEAANDIRDEMTFPGCLPNITSNTTTPKL